MKMTFYFQQICFSLKLFPVWLLQQYKLEKAIATAVLVFTLTKNW